MSTINKVIEEKIFNASLKEIDFDALAKQFKPELEKEIKQELKRYLEDVEFVDMFYDQMGEVMYKYINKVVIPELEKQLGVANPKRKTGGKK